MASCAAWATSVAQATELMRYLARNPAIVQDICGRCHPDRRVPNRPRYNIYRGQEPAILTPCFIEDWF